MGHFGVQPRRETRFAGWPGGSWPKTPAPPNRTAWNQSVRAFLADHAAMCALVADESTDLFAAIPHGDGQTILRERCWWPITTRITWVS